MSRRSTCSQLLATLNDWTLAVNNHAKVDAVYIDFAKAFDSISHVKLLTKIHAYGIDTNLLNWISNYLSERTQSVYIGNTFAKFLPVLSEVPQGSVLGPLLFLLSEVSLETSIQDLTLAMNIIKNTRPVCNKTPDDRIV